MGQKVDFDHYAADYLDRVDRAIAFAPQPAEFFVRLKAAIVDELIARRGPPGTVRALDFGCGPGQLDQHLAAARASLDGVDLGVRALAEARRATPLGRYVCYEGASLPYRDGSFDLAFASCVLHHIPPRQWVPSLREIGRTLAPGGWLAVFEHNPLNPLTRLAVWRCEFDRDATLIGARRMRRLLFDAGFQILEARFIVFAPFKGAVWDRINRGLGWLPLGGQYYLVARKPPRADDSAAAAVTS